ncbi:MAG: 2-oxoglutarate dehydrogenase E1 component [Planctomycetaceae bacterium]
MTNPSSRSINSGSLSYLEDLYAQYVSGKGSVPQEWRDYFQSLQNGNGASQTTLPLTNGNGPFPRRSIFNPPSGGGDAGASFQTNAKQNHQIASLQERLDQLIRNYRVRGHILARLDPLGKKNDSPPELDPAFYGFTEEDLDREMSTSWVGGPSTRTLRGIINWLKQTYCRSIGAQFMHIDSLTDRQWLQTRMEETGNRIKLSRDEQVRILSRLVDAVAFEEFIAKKFVGAKSFSLEGAESLIPLLDMAIEKCGNDGAQEIVIGMAHRGRLNVLANIMGKSPRQIFREFDDKDPHLHLGRGDVKYHLGHSRDWITTRGHKVHLSLCFNPSHLEYVNTVALGRLRAKQDRFGDFERQRGVCFLIHGDAAFAGEGVVQETLNLSKLLGYRVGGAIHIVVNNQVGFTTPPNEARSTVYATDIAKMLQSPILHVNGEDPEAVAQCITLALDFRRTFKRDVVIDMYCYRRRGHNEGDEPEFTQPLMYRKIKQRPSVYEGYLEHLLALRGVTREEANEIFDRRRTVLENELAEARRDDYIRCFDHLGGFWGNYHGGPVSEADHPVTGVSAERVASVTRRMTEVPEGFVPHPKAERILASRREMADGTRPFDWGGAEMAAFGTILSEGRRLRITGQDARRGTFSHRHAVLVDYEHGKLHHLLKNIAPEKGQVNIYNSPLSEAGVLGFEYGYSLDCPEGLVIWEAQFGDFMNCAQVIIDQFIASAEDKWDRLSGLVMLLPHGFEGQGPEHSSARIERFLMLAAEDNMQIAQPSTPAQHFHLLRRQAMRAWKKPLIVFTPKSLLRHPACTASMDDLVHGQFEPVIGDTLVDPRKTSRILLCSGRVYYDLIERREQQGRNDIAIVRLEEFHPFPFSHLQAALAPFEDHIPVVWVQDEPKNMGAWPYLRMNFGQTIADRFVLHGVTRAASASPATGSARCHRLEQEALLAEAFAET